MKFMAVLTSPRPNGASYLAKTLESINNAGEWLGGKLVFSDGIYQDSVPQGWELVTQPNAGEYRSMWAVFKLAVERDAESLTFFEDDIKLCKNALPYIERFEIPMHLSLVTWFSAAVNTSNQPWYIPPANITENHLVEREIRENLTSSEGFRGACAMTITRSTLKLALSSKTQHWQFRHFGDGLLGLVLNGKRIGTHVPNLAQHIGAISSAGNGGLSPDRVSRTYPGDEFDALTLR